MVLTEDAPVTTTNEQYESAIGKAIHLCRTGYQIPLALAIELREQGFDSASIEAAHRR